MSGGSVWAELFHFGVYKQSQGRIARQLTFVVLAVGIALAAYRLWETMRLTPLPQWIPQASALETYLAIDHTLPLTLLLVGLWISFRVVCIPRFADFLIAVEAEMNKVSWPSRGELVRSSMVVIGIILVLAVLLTSFDLLWYTIFSALGVIQR
ncbi:MAG: preprotein translocase subunit SecE [Pirellulaceae bacterium]